MAHGIPMVRAMSLIPAVRWARAHGHDANLLLKRAGLESAADGDPLRPLPLRFVGRLLRDLAEHEGPDIPCRIVAQSATLELALVAKIVLGTRCPLEAFGRVAAALPLFCSHENLFVTSETEGIVLRHSYDCRFDPETEHLMLLYAVAMADRICSITGSAAPRLRHIELPPHPDAGLAHLNDWFEAEIVGSSTHSTQITMDRRVAERLFPLIGRDRLAGHAGKSMTPLRGDGTFKSAARIMLASMLEDAVPRLNDLAEVAGTSTRTMQRWFEAEGTSYAEVLDEVRRDRAELSLEVGDASILAIATELGYERQSSLTRAMRRWTGEPPSRFRRQWGG